MNNKLARTDDYQDLALSTKVNEYIADSVSNNTKRAYASDFRQFSKWCLVSGLQALPATPTTCAAYFAYLVQCGRKYSTIDRARAAIRMAHETAEAEDPTWHKSVKLTLKGIRRAIGTAPTKKAPTLSNDIRSMVDSLPDGVIGIRDRALLLLGFAGAFRRSELAGITVENLAQMSEGVKILLPKSKTDQDGSGRFVGINRGVNLATCPVRALVAWMNIAKIASGPIFRRIDRHGNIKKEAITPQTVALVVKRAATAAGLDAQKYSGHSLRAGFVTQGAMNGASETNIMRQTGHKSHDTVQGYVRIANLFKDNVSELLGL